MFATPPDLMWFQAHHTSGIIVSSDVQKQAYATKTRMAYNLPLLCHPVLDSVNTNAND